MISPSGLLHPASSTTHSIRDTCICEEKTSVMDGYDEFEINQLSSNVLINSSVLLDSRKVPTRKQDISIQENWMT